MTIRMDHPETYTLHVDAGELALLGDVLESKIEATDWTEIRSLRQRARSGEALAEHERQRMDEALRVLALAEQVDADFGIPADHLRDVIEFMGDEKPAAN